MPTTRDTPWRRPGRLAYALRRLRSALRPPISVRVAPDDLVMDLNLPVTMRDGVQLRVNVYRPTGDGPFPVLVSEHPYGKDALPRRTKRGWSLNFQYRIMNQPAPFTVSDRTSWEAPDPVWWTRQGYAVINADARGSGTSGGLGSLFSDQEARDVYDLIEWAAAQPWSSGRVGMLGVSYLAISQYKAAALHPPSLKAICPWEGFTDAYRDFMTPGGVAETGFSRIWLRITRHLARLRVDLAAQRPKHPLRDSWWEALTPRLPDIEVPMLVCASFSDANLHSLGSLRAFEQAGSPDRFAYLHRGPKWATFYGEEAKAAQLAFFDRFLRERDVPAPPRVRLEVRERRDTVIEVRSENEWPIARTRWVDRYLGPSGALSDTAADAPGGVTFDLRRGAAGFSMRFAEDTELTGQLIAQLWVSLAGAGDAALFVGVEKWSGSTWVPFEGSYGYGRDRVAIGRQRVSLRAPDPDAATGRRPQHAFTSAQPVAPGEVVPVGIALSPSATLFRAGESLRLLVAGRYLEPANPLFGHFPARYDRSPRGTCTLHWGPSRQARLRLPVIPQRGPEPTR